jgi:hypothetical protein
MRVALRLLAASTLIAAVSLQAPAGAPIPPAPARSDSPLAAARKALDEVGDMQYQARTLQDVMADLKEKTKVPVIMDNSVYQFGLDPNQPVVNVNLKQVKLRDGLKAVLAPYNLKFGLTADGLFISNEEGVIVRQLRQRVSLDCDGTALAAAIKQLASDTGANLLLDPRLGDAAKKAVTLKLEDVPLETAIRLLAEVAELRAVRMSNVLFVTTHERAEKIRPDADGPTAPSPLNPVFPQGVVGIGGFGGVGGFGVIGGAAVPAPNPPPPQPEEAPKVEKK